MVAEGVEGTKSIEGTFDIMPSCFYILRLQSGILYPGATTNLDQRLADHREGIACRTTKHDPPIDLVYQEKFETFSLARKREAQIKKWTRAKKEALIADDKETLKALSKRKYR